MRKRNIIFIVSIIVFIVAFIIVFISKKKYDNPCKYLNKEKSFGVSMIFIKGTGKNKGCCSVCAAKSENFSQ